MKIVRFFVACLIVFCLVLTGCSSAPKKLPPVTIDSLPGDVFVGEDSIPLAKALFCEVYADHGYTGYCIAAMDRTRLSDDDVYWTLKREGGGTTGLDVCAYLDSAANSIDSERMSKLHTIYNDEYIYFVFYTNETLRNHINDFEIRLQIVSCPDKDILAETTQYYYYAFSSEEGVDYSDYDSILSEEEKDILAEALQRHIEDMKKIYG